jgi:predicted enzyme related to lactoylglutathione lyase
MAKRKKKAPVINEMSLNKEVNKEVKDITETPINIEESGGKVPEDITETPETSKIEELKDLTDPDTNSVNTELKDLTDPDTNSINTKSQELIEEVKEEFKI